MREPLLAALGIGFILDFIIGDPQWLWHPVQGIGAVITQGEKAIRKLFPATKTGERAGGICLVLFVLLLSVGIPAGMLYLAYQLHPGAAFCLEIVFCWQMLAVKSLRTESMKVYTALSTAGILAGRRAVSMIVGRDTMALDEEGIVKAAVETIAENTSDGVTAPLFYMVLGGPLLGIAYKAINTMDSMIGYQNEAYRYFGTAAARLDDVVNYLPARISALCMIIGAWLLRYNGRNAWQIYRRDRKNHKSPNAAQTEAVMAGALDVRLAGDAWYFGTLHEKPFIGDANRSIEKQDIIKACKLEYATAIVCLLVMGGIRFMLC